MTKKINQINPATQGGEIPEYTEQFEIQGVVFHIEMYPFPTTYDVFNHGKKVARLYLRRGLVKCYLGTGDVDGKKIYDANHRLETQGSIDDDMCSRQELETIASLINKEIGGNKHNSKQSDIGSVLLMTLTSSPQDKQKGLTEALRDALLGETTTEKEKKKAIAEKYFTDAAVREKVMCKEFKIIERFPQIFRLFLADPAAFKMFYKEKFKKEPSSIHDLSDQEKYGACIVKARELVRSEENKNFLDEEFKKMPLTTKPHQPKRSKALGFGKWYHDDEPRI